MTDRLAIPMLDLTDAQRTRRRLYRVGDVYLPVAIAGLQAGAAVAFLMVWFPLLRLFGLTFGARSSIVFLAPVMGVVYAFKADEVEGRSPVAYAAARVRWLLGTTTVVGR